MTGPSNVVPISQGPARGYRWEPFKPGNTVAETHGAYSDRVIEPLAAEIANKLMQEHERLRNPLYREAVLEYGRLVAKVERLEEYVDRNGMLDGEGKVRGAADYLLKIRKQAMNVADRLGLTPLANARLGKDSAAAQLDVTKILTVIREGQTSDPS